MTVHFSDLTSKLPKPIEPESGHCDKHGSVMLTGRRLVTGRVIMDKCPRCAAEDEEQERRVAAIQAEARAARKLEKQLEQAAVPIRFIGRNFDNFRAETPEQRRALTSARSYVEDFQQNLTRGDGFIFGGLPGTGKSHLAAAIMQALLPRPVQYLTALDLIRAVRQTWRKDSTTSEVQLLAQLEALHLLVIDELGVQYGTESEKTILFDVLDRRYRNRKPTILLTNEDSEGLKATLGERTYDRLTECSRWIAFTWPSYRKQARQFDNQEPPCNT